MDVNMKYVFISHSNEGVDAEITNRLYAYLTAHNVYCWYDKNMEAGVWAEQIYEKMLDASAYILVASERSLTSKQVKREISHMAESDKTLIPLVLDDYYVKQDKGKGSAGYFLGDNMYQAVFLDKFASEEDAFAAVLRLLPSEISKLDCDLSEFDMDADNETIIKFKGNGNVVSISPFIKTIAQSAFINNTDLCKLMLPQSVERIERRAFFGCRNLIDADGLSRVPQVDESAFSRTGLFADCGGVRFYDGVVFGADGDGDAFVLPKGAVTVAESAFRDGAFRELILPEGLENIGAFAFCDCVLLKSVVIPQSVKYIGKRAFGGCPIKQISFGGRPPEGVSEAFDNYSAIAVTEEE